jgi:hypothetical protein
VFIISLLTSFHPENGFDENPRRMDRRDRRHELISNALQNFS